MRHHDPKLTAMLYTDAAQLPLRDAVESIPWQGCTQIGAQIADADRRTLARVVEAWPQLGGGFKLAILAIVDAAQGESGAR